MVIVSDGGSVGVGGAGNVMVENHGLARSERVASLEYKNGIWVYKLRVNYSIVPVIERSSDALIHHVCLYDDSDVFHIGDYHFTGIACMQNFQGFSLESSSVDKVAEFLLFNTSGRLEIKKLREELKPIRDLELKLKIELGDAYRGRK